MTDIALYRKYRPQTFDELVGQEAVVDTLKNAIDKGAVSHAYMFVGSRGVGKTSAARIFARTLGIDDKDIYELDAASNRKIENFRDLNDSVYTLPFSSPKKIYIIDEVHMLTKEAFNAFLKTLEEPPEHVIFILATTDPEKVPDTVKSRCQIITFNKASFPAIKKAIVKIAEQEGFKIDDNAITLISFLSEGSFRDALGILQRALMVSNGEISSLEVEKTGNVPSLSKAVELARYVSEKDFSSAMSLIFYLEKSGTSFKFFTQLFLDVLRDILLLRVNPKHRENVQEKYSDDFEKILKESAKEALHINSSTLVSLINKMEMFSVVPNSALPLETFVSEIFEQNN